MGINIEGDNNSQAKKEEILKTLDPGIAYGMQEYLIIYLKRPLKLILFYPLLQKVRNIILIGRKFKEWAMRVSCKDVSDGTATHFIRRLSLQSKYKI